MQSVNREILLHLLESVQPGLSSREIIEQSSCFVFQAGSVMTYNDEVACSMPCDVKLEGAVQSAPLLAILRKLSEEDIELEAAEGELVIHGKRRRAGITREEKVLLPVDKVEKPGKWKPLHEDFLEGIKMVQHCASHDESQFSLTCVHVHPTWLEACDNSQATRVKMETGVKASTLVRRDSIKHVVSMGMTEFNETESWIHFRNERGLVLSCRRYVETYPDLKAILTFDGDPIVLPKGLGEAADKAAIFSAENSDDNQVSVDLRPGKLRIRGTGASGWFEERRKIDYDGKELSFLIAPSLLIDLVSKHNEAEITEGRLRVNGGKWRYVTCLSRPAADKGEEKEEAPAEKTEE